MPDRIAECGQKLDLLDGINKLRFRQSVYSPLGQSDKFLGQRQMEPQRSGRDDEADAKRRVAGSRERPFDRAAQIVDTPATFGDECARRVAFPGSRGSENSLRQ